MQPDIDLSILPIKSFLKGNVFITGVTGFLGKVLLEKLLRSCPNISRIFVLIRSNEKYTSEERLEKLFESSAFDRIKEECPTVVQKVISIDGDISKKNLALKDVDLFTVHQCVDFVFHCAASVRFENDPRSTLEINFLGVKNMVNLFRTIDLLAFVHVSTAYSFCNHQIIGEQLYTEDISVESIEEYMNEVSDEDLAKRCKKIAESRPSLYQYSKAMGEIYLASHAQDLPAVIVRPSIITAAAREPFPGWIDNINGPSGFISLSSKGLIKTLQVKKNIYADWVPVDYVANTLIVAAHRIAMTKSERMLKKMRNRIPYAPLENRSGVPIVNCVCPHVNAIKWSEVIKLCVPLLRKYPSTHAYTIPGGVVTSSTVLHYSCRYFYHYLPAMLLDLYRFSLGRKTRYVGDYQRLHKVLDYLQHYTRNRFMFRTMNLNILSDSLSFQDKDIFPIDQRYLQWNQYLEDYVHGVRLFFMKEDDSTLPLARKRLIRLRRLFFFLKATAATGVFYLIIKYNPDVGALIESIPSLLYKRITKMNSEAGS